MILHYELNNRNKVYYYMFFTWKYSSIIKKKTMLGAHERKFKIPLLINETMFVNLSFYFKL